MTRSSKLHTEKYAKRLQDVGRERGVRQMASVYWLSSIHAVKVHSSVSGVRQPVTLHMLDVITAVGRIWNRIATRQEMERQQWALHQQEAQPAPQARLATTGLPGSGVRADTCCLPFFHRAYSRTTSWKAKPLLQRGYVLKDTARNPFSPRGIRKRRQIARCFA